MRAGDIPSALKKAIVTPIYKGGERRQAANYRPVALTSHIVKIFERIIVRKLVEHFDKYELWNKRQHGFRRGRSCLSQLLEHYDNVLKALENGNGLDVLYLDFEKAFDKVDFGVLCRKLSKLGIGGQLMVWIKNFLIGRTQRVVVQEELSQETSVRSGVPQGSVLGPVLFLCMMGDIDADIVGAKVSSFADDTRISHEIRNQQDTELLQENVMKIYTWAERKNMHFNDAKFEVIHYGRTAPVYEYISSAGVTIEAKKEVKDLGVLMTDSADFDVQICKVVKQAKGKMGWILRIFATREQQAMLSLYRALVMPILEYCSQLWSPWKIKHKIEIESVQRTFTNRIAEVKHLNYWERLRVLKLYSLERRRERYILLYMWKIQNGFVPNINDQIVFRQHLRLGCICERGNLNNRAQTRVYSQKANFITIRGPILFNCLPRSLRDGSFNSVSNFKKALDKYLQTLPDEPKLPHYYPRAASNSIVDQAAQLRVDSLPRS